MCWLALTGVVFVTPVLAAPEDCGNLCAEQFKFKSLTGLDPDYTEYSTMTCLRCNCPTCACTGHQIQQYNSTCQPYGNTNIQFKRYGTGLAVCDPPPGAQTYHVEATELANPTTAWLDAWYKPFRCEPPVPGGG
jgi:hypothetical protein